MQQEDDLRAIAKIMDFMREKSKYFVCGHKYLLVLLPVDGGMGYRYRCSR